jgi:neprilysin
MGVIAGHEVKMFFQKKFILF